MNVSLIINSTACDKRSRVITRPGVRIVNEGVVSPYLQSVTIEHKVEGWPLEIVLELTPGAIFNDIPRRRVLFPKLDKSHIGTTSLSLQPL